MESTINFTELLRNNPDGLTLEQVKELSRRFPFFTVPVSMLLRRDSAGRFLDPEERRNLSAMLALNAGDVATMMRLIDKDAERWIDFYPSDEPITKSTEDTIDTFLENYGKADEKETALLERLIFNPMPDYSQVLEQQEQDEPSAAPTTGDEQDDRIAAFIASHSDKSAQAPEAVSNPAPAVETAKPQPAEKKAPAVPNATGSLTESLARIYIRQQKFDKAYEIISNLSVNYPDKNPYYEDQLRFLRKAMAARGLVPNV